MGHRFSGQGLCQVFFFPHLTCFLFLIFVLVLSVQYLFGGWLKECEDEIEFDSETLCSFSSDALLCAIDIDVHCVSIVICK